ncbi:MAG: hypothetical protein J0M04_08110 [Verrucomicrobia bacterium]|nr:hypothetical protein [Verrucomicrobiota bacterium]
MSGAAAKPRTRKSSGGPTKMDDRQLALWQEDSGPEAKPRRRKASADEYTAELPQDPKLVAVVGQEILTGRYHPGVWALALAKSARGREEAEAEYARLRLLSLNDELSQIRRKEVALEERRRAVFRKAAIPEAAPRKGNVRRNHRVPMAPMLALWLGASGALAMTWRFSGGKGTGLATGSDMAAHLALGALLVAVVWVMNWVFPGSRRVIRHCVPLLAVLLAAASLFGAVVVLKDASASDLFSKAPKRTVPSSRVANPAKSPEPEANIPAVRVAKGKEF